MKAQALRSPRAVADVTEGLILASVEIAAPMERVFRALASDEITRWWGAEDLYRTTEWSGDVRPGGSWRVAGVAADGKPFSVSGEYLEVESPSKLVMTWLPDWGDATATTVAYRLEAVPGGTRVTVRHTGFIGRADACLSHTQGWERVLGWLDAHFPIQGGAA